MVLFKSIKTLISLTWHIQNWNIYKVFNKVSCNYVLTRNDFFTFNQVNILCFVTFWSKNGLIVTQNVLLRCLLQAFLLISLFVFKNSFFKHDLFMVSLLKLLFIKGEWLALTYLFVFGACVSRVVFTDSCNFFKRKVLLIIQFWPKYFNIFF